jgi:hypothetical protein
MDKLAGSDVNVCVVPVNAGISIGPVLATIDEPTGRYLSL